MRIAEVLLLDFDPEVANTRRVLERIPDKDPEWRPHEKSMPIGRLALHTARLPEFGSMILTAPDMDLARDKFPDLTFQSTAHLLSELDQSAAKIRSQLQAAGDAELGHIWRLSYGERLLAEGPRMALYRTMFFNHLIHHRTQLSVYLRLLGVPVPGLYGPSADEPFG